MLCYGHIVLVMFKVYNLLENKKSNILRSQIWFNDVIIFISTMYLYVLANAKNTVSSYYFSQIFFRPVPSVSDPVPSIRIQEKNALKL